MKKLFTLLFISFVFIGKSQTVVYDVPVSGLVGMVINSGDFCFDPGEQKQQSVGNTWGFSWTSTNANPATSVSIQFAFTIEEGGGPYPTTLNGTADTAINPAAVSCNPNLVTYSLDPVSYNSGGLNTFLINTAGNQFQSQIINLISICSSCFAQVTVVYNSGGCLDPTVPTLTANPNPVCEGDSAIITINGTLNDATAWSIYSGSCGGTLVGTTSGNSFAVTPSSPSTTYYVRGEGGCVTPGNCGNVAISVTSADSTLLQNGNTLTANQFASSYQWVDCNTSLAISGETSQSYTPTASGTYGVIMNVNGCFFMSECVNVTITGINSISENSNLNIYPNPVHNELFVDMNGETADITITDMSGRIVYAGKLPAGKRNIQLDIPGGIYAIEIITSEGNYYSKFIKE